MLSRVPPFLHVNEYKICEICKITRTKSLETVRKRCKCCAELCFVSTSHCAKENNAFVNNVACEGGRGSNLYRTLG